MAEVENHENPEEKEEQIVILDPDQEDLGKLAKVITKINDENQYFTIF